MRNGDNLSDKELIGDDDIAIEVDSSPMGGYSSSSSIFEDSDVLISDQESFISLEDAQNACLKTGIFLFSHLHSFHILFYSEFGQCKIRIYSCSHSNISFAGIFDAS